MTSTDEEAKEVVEAYLKMWNEKRFSEIPDLVSDSFVMYDPAAPEEGVAGPEGEIHGPDGLRQFLELTTAGFPDFEITVFDMVADDGLVMYEGQHSGTHEGHFNGIPPTGREFEVSHMSRLTVEGGVIQEHRAYFNLLDSFDELGLTFPTVVRQAPKLALGKLRAML